MKVISKQLISSIILGIVLYTPLTDVYAAELTNGPINGINDNYGIYRTGDNGIFTYDFQDDEQLSITDGTNNYGIYINDNAVKQIKINNKLDIDMNKHSNGYGYTLNGVSIFSNVSNKIIDRSAGGNIKITSSGMLNGSENVFLNGAKISAGDNNKIVLGNTDIKLQADNARMSTGLYVENGENNLISMGNGSIEITGTDNLATDSSLTGMSVWNNNTINTGDVSVNINVRKLTEQKGDNIYLNNIGIYAADNGQVKTGNGDIEVYGESGSAAYANGIFAYNGGSITKTGGVITATAKGDDTLIARGVLAHSGSIIDIGIANIRTQTIGGDAANGIVKSIGLLSSNSGVINYQGGTIVAKADNKSAYVAAVSADTGGSVNINKNTFNNVVINGDVNNSGDGAIFLNLNTSDSVLNGRFFDNNGTFQLKNNAVWNVTGNSIVKDFNIENGIVNMNTQDSNVNIKNYFGKGTVSFSADDVDVNGTIVVNTGIFEIDNAEKGSNLVVGVSDNTINTIDIVKTGENLNALANKIFYHADDNNLEGQVIIKEGLITPAARGKILFDENDQGYVADITRGNRTTETMEVMKNIAATAIVAWRQEDSTLNQRLGELRSSEDGQGIWVRMSRGEFEYDGEYKNQYNFFQMGYDWAADDWHYGAAISHNDGQTTYIYGDGENRSTSLSLYGTWLGDKGHYADIVLKQGRLSNDFDIYTSAGHTSGDYDAWGTSLSGEYGKKISIEDNWYVTPQAQLTLMRIGSEDYVTDNGINVHQDTLHSAVGRLGFELGKKIDDKGSIYGKASLLHDFAGNAETYLSNNGFVNSYSQDISDTWCEAGIGFNYKTSDNSYVYADVVKTFGGDVETSWQWNAGMRWSF